MRSGEYSKEQIESVLKQLAEGASINDLCQRYEISPNTLYKWKSRYGGEENLLKRLEELEQENFKLKGALADIEIQRHIHNTGDLDHVYRILAANIPGTAITILDRDERYLLAEGDFLLKMGYQKETMPGKKISEVISPENYHGYYEGVIQRAFAGEVIVVERQTISGYYSFMKVVPLRNNREEIFAIMFVLIDVTPIKEAQFKLAKINEELELKVQERTEQLREANRQLESFSYSVSHDLRAPLRSISGFASILKEDYSDKIQDQEFDRLTERVIANALKMENLINDLLEFSRYERKSLSKTSIDMPSLVDGVLRELTVLESGRKLEIEVSNLVSIEADLSLIRQVWINLLSNALKYSSKKDVTKIRIACWQDGEVVCYSISDNGAGFDMKYADRLFGVFQRLHKSSEFEGTGVGLALAKSIIHRHGGKIWAEAEVDMGATFYFTLPLAQ